MTSPAEATPAFLAEHYVYEINMLRATYNLLPQARHRALANALIEAFAVHARALMDFFGSRAQRNDCIAGHFTESGTFVGAHTACIPASVRERLNKQIAHLTYKRGRNKIGFRDRLVLLQAVEKDHAVFKANVAPEFAGCFNEHAFGTKIPQ